MRLFIMRHGEASFDAESDRQRPLTEKGLAEVRRVVAASLPSIGEQSVLWVSHLLRAQQTAQQLCNSLSIVAQEQTFLGPDADPDRVIQALSKLDPDATVILVSHQPLLGNLVSLLCHGHPYEPHPFTTAEMVYLECELPARGLAEFNNVWRAD